MVYMVKNLLYAKMAIKNEEYLVCVNCTLMRFSYQVRLLYT